MFDRRAFLAGSLAVTAATRAAASTIVAGSSDGWAGADAILARIKPPVFPAADFRITDHGATTGQPAHVAIQATVDACAAAGGGRVVVPAGTWRLNGPIHLRSNVELHLESGATLRFGRPGEIDLPLVLTRWEGTECWNFSPLIYARGCENIAITGAGTFDGQGKAGFFKWRAQQDADKETLRNMGATGVPVDSRVFGPGHFLRPGFVQFIDCRNVLVDGPKFEDSPFWTIHPVYSTNVTVRNVHVVSKHLNSDGCDPDSCEDVLIEKCKFDISDDCIAIKSGRDQDGWRVARPSRNIVIRDCQMKTDVAAAIAIGSEMSGGANNIFVERLTVHRAEHAIYIKANRDRGGVVEQVRVRDVTVADSSTLINVTTDYHHARGKAPSSYRGMTLERINCAQTGQAVRVIGASEAPVVGLAIRDVLVKAADTPAVIQHARDLTLDQVRVNGQLLRR